LSNCEPSAAANVTLSYNRAMSDAMHLTETKITVRLPAGLLQRVDEAARLRGVPRSELVREALVAHVDRPAASAGATLYDLLAADGVLGRFSAPPDLSTTDRAGIRARVADRHRAGPRRPRNVAAPET
jgi:hypothetical protein